MSTIAIDLDGTIAEWAEDKSVLGPPASGAKEFLDQLHELGYEIVIHTCRINYEGEPEEWIDKISSWLEENEIPYDRIWTDKGKPIAVAYIDDRGLAMNTDFISSEMGRAITLKRIQHLCSSGSNN